MRAWKRSEQEVTGAAGPQDTLFHKAGQLRDLDGEMIGKFGYDQESPFGSAPYNSWIE